ncbi:MAG TPA: hypothetical protein PLM63_03970 [bacterium]|nr:hypothetical protein [bacterium]
MQTKLINKEKLAEEIATPETNYLYGHKFCNEDCNHFNLCFCTLFCEDLEELEVGGTFYRCKQCKECFKEVKNEN